MKKIVFQGDSITESNRAKDEKYQKEYTGSGYPTLIAADLGVRLIHEYEFVNRGISGNRVVDILARMKADIVNLQPDVVSILAGINDVLMQLLHGTGTDAGSYEKIYDVLLSEIKNQLPDVRLMILEPFVLKGQTTQDQWKEIRKETEKRAQICRKLALKYRADFVPLQQKFDEMYEKAPMGYWLFDGVHPTSAGHRLIADEWIKAFYFEAE